MRGGASWGDEHVEAPRWSTVLQTPQTASGKDSVDRPVPPPYVTSPLNVTAITVLVSL